MDPRRQLFAYRLLPVLILGLGGSGCMIPTKVAALNPEIPRDAAPIVIHSSIQTLDDHKTKVEIEHMLASPEMRAVERELISGVLDGSLSSLGERDRATRIASISSHFIAGIVKSSMHEAMSEDNRRSAERFISSMTQTTVQSMAKGIADADVGGAASDALTTKIGPAFQKVLREDIAPGVGATLNNDDVQRGLGATARVMGREMVLGATEALSKDRDAKPADDSVLGHVSNFVKQGAKAVGSLAGVLLAVALLLGVWIARLLWQARKYRGEADQRAMTSHLLREAMKASEGKPWADELLGALEERLEADEDAVLRVRAARQNRRGKAITGGGAPKASESPA